MKKLVLSVFATALLGLPFAAFAQYKDGEYTAKAQGKEGDINVTVKVADSKIADIVIGDNDETEAILMGAVDELIPAIIEKQGTEGIDVVAGATLSSTGIINAVNAALEQAK